MPTTRVEKLAFNSGGAVDVVDYTYFGLGGVAKTNYPQPATSNTMANGSSFSGFDRFGRVIDVLWTNSTFGDSAQLKYGYDRVSNRTYRQDVKAGANNFDELYGYDNLQRLTAFDRGALDGTPLDHISTPTKRQTWNLDPTGNWNGFTSIAEGTPLDGLVQQRTANAANEIKDITETVGDQWKTPVHDAAGNMTKLPQPAAPTSEYDCKYDAWNRLVTVKVGATPVATYEYDGLNRRTTKLVGSTTTDFYYSDTWQVVEEQVSSVVKEQFVWGQRYIDDLVLRDRTDPVERLYALQDVNWNVVALIDIAPVVKQRFVYDAYGTSTALNDNFTPYSGGTDYAWEYRFTGRRFDIETGLYYYRWRYYHSLLGRFVTTDPNGYGGGINPYAYVGNAPSNWLDPLGLQRRRRRGLLLRDRNLTKEQRECLKKMSDRYASLLPLISLYTPQPCPSPCKLITIIIKLPHSCATGLEGKGLGGHTGVAIGDNFYDFGPAENLSGKGITTVTGTQWWDNPNYSVWAGSGKTSSEDIGLKDIVGNLEKLARTKRGRLDVLKIEVCVCADEAAKVEKWWKDEYKKIAEGKSKYNVANLQCTTATINSLNAGLGRCTQHNINNQNIIENLKSLSFGAKMIKAPISYLKRIKKHVKHGCGKAKGHGPTIVFLKTETLNG